MKQRQMQRQPNRRRDDEQHLDVPSRTQAMPVYAQDVLGLQRDVGNRAVADLLRAEAAPFAVDESQAGLDAGQVLAPSLRATMARAYGQDFSEVRVHTGGAAARLADRENAHAVTIGQDIAFGSGAYQPGTAIGDVIMAHELAHVVQQRNATTLAAPGTVTQVSLERDANRAAMGALGLFGRLGSGLRRMAPRLRTGLALQSCARTEEMEMPEFFGEHSRATAERIAALTQNLNWAQLLMTGAAAGDPFSTPPERLARREHEIDVPAEAIMALSDTQRAEVIAQIDLLTALHGNELNEQERRFWGRVRTQLEEAAVQSLQR